MARLHGLGSWSHGIGAEFNFAGDSAGAHTAAHLEQSFRAGCYSDYVVRANVDGEVMLPMVHELVEVLDRAQPPALQATP